MKNENAEAILKTLARLRAVMPKRRRPVRKVEAATRAGGSDFELDAVAEALQSTAEELRGALDEAEAKMVNDALEVYYAAEELARHPDHADLIPHVEAMRKAYERDFGRPIPERAHRS